MPKELGGRMGDWRYLEMQKAADETRTHNIDLGKVALYH